MIRLYVLSKVAVVTDLSFAIVALVETIVISEQPGSKMRRRILHGQVYHFARVIHYDSDRNSSMQIILEAPPRRAMDP